MRCPVAADSTTSSRPPGEKRDPAFLEHAVRLAPGSGRKRVCFIPTATGDAPGAIDAVTEVFAADQQDVLRQEMGPASGTLGWGTG